MHSWKNEQDRIKTVISDIITPTSRPENGEVFTEKAIFTVGSSTLIVGRGFPCTLSAIVSPIWKQGNQDVATQLAIKRIWQEAAIIHQCYISLSNLALNYPWIYVYLNVIYATHSADISSFHCISRYSVELLINKKLTYSSKSAGIFRSAHLKDYNQ